MITLPMKGATRLEIGYWSTKGSGQKRATEPLNIYAANVATGELVSSSYTLSNFRVSWNYLTFPVPALDSKFRVKTYWEVQHTRIRPVVSFPESQNPFVTVGAKQSITLPGAGIGFEIVPSRAFRFDARISGMAFPNKPRYVDAEATFIGTIGAVEVFGGAKGFHFRTTLNDETYQQATIWGPRGGAPLGVQIERSRIHSFCQLGTRMRRRSTL